MAAAKPTEGGWNQSDAILRFHLDVWPCFAVLFCNGTFLPFKPLTSINENDGSDVNHLHVIISISLNTTMLFVNIGCIFVI